MNRRAVTVVENRALVEVTTADMREADSSHNLWKEITVRVLDFI